MQDEGVQFGLYRNILKRLGDIETNKRLLDFELDTGKSVVKSLKGSCEELTDEVARCKRELVSLQNSDNRLAEAIRLQTEARNGVESALRHEVAVHYTLKNELHKTMTEQLNAESAKNQISFEKRRRATAILATYGIEGSVQTDVSTEADVSACGDHFIATEHGIVDATVTKTLMGHQIICALGNNDTDRLRLAYLCYREAKQNTKYDIPAYKDVVKSLLNKMKYQVNTDIEDPIHFLFSLVESITMWRPTAEEVWTRSQIARLKSSAIRRIILSSNNLFSDPETHMFGSAGLQQAVDISAQFNGEATANLP